MKSSLLTLAALFSYICSANAFYYHHHHHCHGGGGAGILVGCSSTIAAGNILAHPKRNPLATAAVISSSALGAGLVLGLLLDKDAAPAVTNDKRIADMGRALQKAASADVTAEKKDQAGNGPAI